MHVIAGAEQGGAETFFSDAADALAERAVEQYVVTRDHNKFRLDRLAHKQIPFQTASFNKFIRWPTKNVIRKVAADFDPDIIQYWMGRAGTFSIKTRAKNIAWYGGYYKVRRFPHCTHHIGVTRDLARHIIDQGVPPKNVRTIHTYAVFDVKDPISRSTFKTPEEVPLLLALARLHPKKAIDVLLKALVDVPDAYLWIAGDGPLKNELQELTKTLGLEHRVRFLGWRNDREALLATADICVFPSRYEPFGTVTIEAWAAKTPLVAAKAAGPEAYIEHDVNGLLVEIDDVDGLSSAINRLIANSELQKRLVKGGTEAFDAQFTRSVFQEEALKFYQEVLQS